jgi:hypothetical protein
MHAWPEPYPHMPRRRQPPAPTPAASAAAAYLLPCFCTRRQSYEAWSAYGCEVPVRIQVDGVWQEVRPVSCVGAGRVI